MANPIIYTVTMPSGNTYDLVDQGARDLIKELMNFREWLGVTTSEIDEGSSTNPILINGESVTAEAGDVVSRDSDHKDFIFSSTGVWQNFGELTGLGALAFKDSASGSYTPTGTISAPTFTGTTMESTGSYTPSGTISNPEFTGASMTSTGSYTPSGSISEVAIGTTSVSTVKSVGTLATCTMPTFTVSNGNLTITDGSYVAGTLPESESVTVASGTVTSQPTFTGTTETITVEGTTAGSVGALTFTGTTETITVTGTTAGTVGTSEFTGNAATITVS